MTVRELKTGVRAGMLSSEFTEWLAFMDLEQQDRNDLIEAKVQPVVIIEGTYL